MAYSYPLNLAQFSDQLRVVGLSMRCPTPQSSSRTASGEVLRARLGASLWQGECILAFEQLANTRGMRGLIDLLMDENASFMFSPHDYNGPRADPGAVLLGSRTVALQAVASNNRDVTLAGFTPGYVLSGDDLLSWSYGANPTRFACHRVITPAIEAGADGRVTVEVWPRVRPGWAVGAGVSLKAPRFKAVMESSEAGTSARVFLNGMSFNYIQTLR